MKRPQVSRVFARTEPAGFVGRRAELDRLMKLATGSDGIALLAAPSVGTSELLRQVYDRIFLGQEDIIPFYFEMRTSDATAQNTAVRFLREFLLQTVAFRRRDSRIIDAAPDIDEIADLAVPADTYWIDRLVAAHNSDDTIGDERSFVRNCLSSPLRAAANNARPFVLIDNFDAIANISGGDALLDDICEIFGRAEVPFVIAGHRRFMFGRTPFETMPLDSFSFSEAGEFVEGLSRKNGVAIKDQTRDLIATQLGSSAGHITSLFAAAAANNSSLDTFERVEQTYTDEIFGGRIGRYYDAIFNAVLPAADAQKRILRLFSENLAAPDCKAPVTYWQRHAGLDGEGPAPLIAVFKQQRTT